MGLELGLVDSLLKPTLAGAHDGRPDETADATWTGKALRNNLRVCTGVEKMCLYPYTIYRKCISLASLRVLSLLKLGRRFSCAGSRRLRLVPACYLRRLGFPPLASLE